MKEEIRRIRQSNGLRYFEQKQKVAEKIVQDLKEKGFFVCTDQSSLYFFWNGEHRLLQFDHPRFAALIEDWYGLNKSEKEWDYLLEFLKTEAIQRGEKTRVHRFARYENNVLYVSRFDGYVYRLDGKSITLIPNGKEGMLFLDNPTWRPYEYLKAEHTGDENARVSMLVNRLVKPVNFSKEDVRLNKDEQAWLFYVWLVSLFFESLLPTKVILVLKGPTGSGKTSTMRWILRFLFGDQADVMDMHKAKEDAFLAAINSNYVLVCDNLDENIGWLNDHLAAASTGAAITLRKLYTTNEAVTYRPRAFLCLTTRTPHFRREDVADRLLLLHVSDIKNELPEFELQGAILMLRNKLWTAMLDELSVIVRMLAEKPAEVPPVGFRMADFAKLAWRISCRYGYQDKLREALRKLEMDKAEFALVDDPLFPALQQWLREPGNPGREITMKELNSELLKVAGELGISWKYASAQALGTRVAHLKGTLEKVFVLKHKDAAHGVKVWQFFSKDKE